MAWDGSDPAEIAGALPLRTLSSVICKTRHLKRKGVRLQKSNADEAFSIGAAGLTGY